MAQTDRQTHEHGDSMTNSAQWGRVGENSQIGSNCVFNKRLQKLGIVVKPTVLFCLKTKQKLKILKTD